ncbi:MAG: hypothetical protein RHS_0526 [Robinsoniella sp. RHS]|nr:MAG: hypothetical protein RHS_0526 [Robinsoniella sp. RHS]
MFMSITFVDIYGRIKKYGPIITQALEKEGEIGRDGGR